ncbi:DUF2092 domain-containing protein [Phenylobacterium sp. NIBR 498073]|uniref:DUF2092 domain-containing protein n=1 Tax=Phenylobacterium sp. NIBR 498073 TaxID=3015177 RepID=UPI0022B2E846|nr:DUF2092 domain-containing protein [Phenylobacterium sp. NIBR 498073]WGU41775.1 DUF2092 domain-containing protein [Phenylobacterium sp. NIBR 498073]
MRTFPWLSAMTIAALLAGNAYAQPAPAPAAPAGAADSDIDPDAIEALRRMSAYLGTQTSFELKSSGAFDLVLDDGQRLQFGDNATFKVRRPNGFVIERVGDYKDRRFTYDGKQLTVSSPRTAYYAQVEAPPTIRETLALAADRYGIELPLTDLFRWSEPGGGRADDIQEALYVGPALIDGTPTDHYAFREAEVDWQIWIAQGDSPVPRKIVITDRTDPSSPQYTATLSWNFRPAFDAQTFAFQAPAGALPIRLTALGK